MLEARPTARILTALLLALPAYISPAAAPPASAQVPLPYERGLSDLALRLSKGLKGSGVKNLAVADFVDTDGGTSNLGRWLQEELTNRFAALEDRPELIERERLDQVLKELKLQGSGLFDAGTAAEVGRISGVDAVIYGSFVRNATTLTVYARTAWVDTAKITTAAAAVLSLEGIPAMEGGRPSKPPLESSAHRAPGQALATWEAGPLHIEITSLQRQFDRKRATVGLRFVNRTESVIFIAIEKENFGICSSSLKDEQGSAHQPLAGGRGAGIACVTKTAKRSDFTHLPPGPTSVSMTFKANEGDMIYGDRFHLDIRLVQLDGDARVRYAAGFEDLILGP